MINKLKEEEARQTSETGQSRTEASDAKKTSLADSMVKILTNTLNNERKNFTRTKHRMSDEKVKQYVDAIKTFSHDKNIPLEDVKKKINEDINHYQKLLEKEPLIEASRQRLSDHITMLEQINKAL